MMKKIKIDKLFLVTTGVITNIADNGFSYYVFPYQFYCIRKYSIFKRRYVYIPVYNNKIKLYEDPKYNLKLNNIFIYSYINYNNYSKKFGDEKVTIAELRASQILINKYNNVI